MSKDFGDSVKDWFEDRGLIRNSTPNDQMLKLMEEVGELSKAVAHNDDSLFIDSVGDICVVLAGMCAQKQLHFETCLLLAWDEIKDRKGHLNENGVFVKE